LSVKFLSLFSGIGGIDRGLQQAGMRCVGQVEIDPFCRNVLARHMPSVTRFADVQQFTQECAIDRPELIAGGFPCQDISRAGRGRGIDGERSGLWREFCRIISELRPELALVENSPALTERGMGTVLGDLAAIGFDAEWDCLPAAAFGAFHLRDRLFILAYTDTARWQGVLCGEPRTVVTSRPLREAVTLADGCRRLRGIIEGVGEPAVFGSDDGLPTRLERVSRLAAIGNSVYVPVVEWIGRRIMERAA
jgi:DNA (cytosine-5)-methyltransferase 1